MAAWFPRAEAAVSVIDAGRAYCDEHLLASRRGMPLASSFISRTISAAAGWTFSTPLARPVLAHLHYSSPAGGQVI